MRIFYINDNRLPTEKAHGYQIMKMCEEFSRLGAEVRLVVPRRKNPIREDAFAYYSSIAKIFSITYLPIIDLISARLFQRRPWSIPAYFFSKWTYLWQVRTFARTQIRPGDIVYTRCFEIAWLLRRHYVMYEVHIISHLLRMWRTPWRVASQLVVITKALRDDLVHQYSIPAEKITVAPDAVDLQLFMSVPSQDECRKRLCLPAHAKIVGFIGRFMTVNEEKGIPELIMSLAYLPDDVMLLAVGGPMRMLDVYERIAHENGVKRSRFLIIDRQPQTEVPLWITACDVVTIPWRGTEFYAQYASPLKVFEYMAAGKPIVSSDLRAIREVLNENNAVFVTPGEPHSLASGIERILTNPVLAERLGRQAKKDVQRFTWAARAEKILHAYHSYQRDR